MLQIRIINDKPKVVGEVNYLGVPKDKLPKGKYDVFPEDYDGWFPFMRLCYSLGDLGIISAMFRVLKSKHPKMKIAIPSQAYVNELFKEGIKTWSYDGKSSGAKNMEVVWGGNPYIDGHFNTGAFNMVFTDHDRAYTELVNDGEQIRSCDEPLVEQILRRFGFSDEELSQYDLSPEVYFTEEECERNEKILTKLVGEDMYGCLLFSARSDTYKSRWDHEHMLYEAGEKFRDRPVFFFSEHPLKGTEWDTFFPNRFDFRELKLSIKDQIYIKRRALFNIGYQSGISDTSYGSGTEMHTLGMNNTIRENCIRGVHYYFKNGTKKTY